LIQHYKKNKFKPSDSLLIITYWSVPQPNIFVAYMSISAATW